MAAVNWLLFWLSIAVLMAVLLMPAIHTLVTVSAAL